MFARSLYRLRSPGRPTRGQHNVGGILDRSWRFSNLSAAGIQATSRYEGGGMCMRLCSQPRGVKRRDSCGAIPTGVDASIRRDGVSDRSAGGTQLISWCGCVRVHRWSRSPLLEGTGTSEVWWTCGEEGLPPAFGWRADSPVMDLVDVERPWPYAQEVVPVALLEMTATAKT